jgi:hypothetical protein
MEGKSQVDIVSEMKLDRTKVARMIEAVHQPAIAA